MMFSVGISFPRAVPGGGPQGYGPPQSAKILKQIWPHFGQHPAPRHYAALPNRKSWNRPCSFLDDFLIVSYHVIKSFVKFIRTFLDLQLFTINFILNIINSLVKFGNVHLSILKLSLCDLVFVLKS